jgi:hypothetical protein
VLSEETQGKGPRLLNKPHTEGCAVACDDVPVANAFAGVCGSARRNAPNEAVWSERLVSRHVRLVDCAA